MIFELQLCSVDHKTWRGSCNFLFMTLGDTSTHQNQVFEGEVCYTILKQIILHGDLKCVLQAVNLAQKLITSHKPTILALLFCCPTTIFGPLSREQPHSHDVNHCVLSIFYSKVIWSYALRLVPYTLSINCLQLGHFWFWFGHNALRY